MTDRQMLEAAAWAAGNPVKEWVELDDCYFAILSDGSPWQPLEQNVQTDCDGDALRLAVKLGIDVSFYAECDGWFDSFSRATWYSDDESYGECDEPNGRCKSAATRRAIVRAAAALDRGQE